MASIHDRSRTLARVLLWGTLLAGALACATTPQNRVDPATLSDVWVEHEGDTRVIVLLGVTDPVFTASERQDPHRLVVDLAGVRPGEASPSVPVFDGLVEEVAVATLATAGGEAHTRVEVGLSEEASHEVVPGEDRLEIRLSPAIETAADLGEAWADPNEALAWTPEAEEGQWGDGAESAASTEEPEGPPATMLTDIETMDSEEGTRIELRTDGTPSQIESFVLEDPARLVIDLPGLAGTSTPGRIDVGSLHAARIRVGEHGDKVRVVIDGGESVDPFVLYRTVRQPAGVTVMLGAAADVEESRNEPPPQAPLAEASEEAVEPGSMELAAARDAARTEPPAPPAEGAQTHEAEKTAAMDDGDTAEPAAMVEAQVAAQAESVTEPDVAAKRDAAMETAHTSEEHVAAASDVPTEPGAAAGVAGAEETAAAAETPAEQEAAAKKAMAGADGDTTTEPPLAEATWDTDDASVAATETESAADSATASPEETPVNQIYGVQLDSQPTRERVAVLSHAPVDYRLVGLDDETLVLRILSASIDPEAAVRLTPQVEGPLSLLTAFQQPETDAPEVRIVMKRAARVEPEVAQHGTTLLLDFPRGTSAAAATPEASEEPSSTAAAKAVAQAREEMAPAAPAAIDPNSPLEILEEGGLSEGKQYVGRRISLDFKDVDINDVLRLIAEVSDLNIIAADDVDGKVTIRLVDVPWDQALDVILLTKGLGFVRVGSVLRIAPAELLKQEEEARLQERRAREKLEDLVVKLQPVNYADVKEIAKMVKKLLTPNRGSVDVDERTNTVIIKDIASVIDEATALIKAIDTQTPQVLIETKIVEARLNFSREIGSTWAFGTQPFNDGFVGEQSGARRDLTVGEDVAFHNNPLLTAFTETFNHVLVANPISSAANGLLDLGAFILDDKFNIELRLEAAESNGEGKVISSPRVVTLDNREAEIEQGVAIPFQTKDDGDTKLEFIDAVLKLKVKPHITADRSIIMNIQVERNAPDPTVPTSTGDPGIAKNEARTETLVKDGQTLVIGGIYVIDKSEGQTRVPFFHKIPLIGPAFRMTNVRDERRELLIFVTPRIVVNPDQAS
jgi:type IV pilus assembly protein PilQ